MKYDIHGVGQALKSALRNLKKDESILPRNKKMIFKFDSYLLSLGLTDSRRSKYLVLLKNISRKVKKPFEDLTKEDIMRIVTEIQKNTGFSEWSKADKKITIKRFYKWLKGNDEFYPPEVRWIKAKVKNDRCKLPEELITEDDVKRLADAATTARDKALVQCLYESGCRIAELLTIQLKNVKFDDYGAVLRVTGKTGDRRIRIVASAPSLAVWMDLHPHKGNPEAFLWSRNLHKGAKDCLPFRYNNAMMLIRRLAKKAGIIKRVNPHTFRHSRATALASKLTEAQMKEFFGWVQGSDMAAVYVHLSGRDIDNAILDVYNLKNKPKETDQFKPIECPRCSATNSPGSKFCIKCGYALAADVAIQMEDNSRKNDVMERLMKDPEFKELVLRKLRE